MHEESLKYIKPENIEYLDVQIHDPNEYDKRHYYLNNPNLKRAYCNIAWTKEMVDEYFRCKEDIHYFACKYVKIITQDKGKVQMEPWWFQHELWNDLNEHRFNIILASRQTSKTTTVAVWLAHQLNFFGEQVVLILANLANTARKILNDNVKLIYENLPFWMQAGVVKWNAGSIELENKSKAIALASKSEAARGYSANICYVDEFAFIEDSEGFMAKSFPVISASKEARFIVTSTANGVSNEFYRIWKKATEDPENSPWHPIEWKWNIRPDRDERFKEQMIASFGMLKWKQEYENQFLVSDKTLINLEVLDTLKPREPILYLNNGDIKIYKKPEKDHNYIMTVDVGRGVGQDYSVFSVFDVSVDPFEQVCTYRSNEVSTFLFPNIIDKIGRYYNEALVIVENNDAGIVVAGSLNYEIEYPNLYTTHGKDDSGLGINMNKKVKNVGCMTAKELIEKYKLQLYDETTIKEFTTFEERGASYAAVSPAHDDMVMTVVLFAYFTTTDMFEDIVKGRKRISEIIRENEEEIIFGVPSDIDALTEEQRELLFSFQRDRKPQVEVVERRNTDWLWSN